MLTLILCLLAVYFAAHVLGVIIGFACAVLRAFSDAHREP